MSSTDLVLKQPEITDYDSNLSAYPLVKNEEYRINRQYASMKWLSCGQARFVPGPNTPHQFFVFEKSLKRFTLFIDFLIDEERQALAHVATKLFQTDSSQPTYVVDKNQISRVPYQYIQATIQLETKEVIGKGVNLGGRPPFPLVFEGLALDTMRDIETMLKNNCLLVKLKLGFNGTESITNKLVITSQTLQELNLKEKVFGDAQQVYVTRDQMTQLTNIISKKLKIQETYQIPNQEFEKEFVNEFINKAGESHFKPIDFEEAVTTLSHYSLDIKDDLRPDEIKRHMQNLITVNNKDSRNYLKINTEHLDRGTDTGSSSVTAKASASFCGFGGKAGASVANSYNKSWENSNKSLNEQLDELKTHCGLEFEYDVQGKVIVPKRLDVIRMMKSSFETDTTLTRLKTVQYDNAIPLEFEINSSLHNLCPINPTPVLVTYDLTSVKDIGVYGHIEALYKQNQNLGLELKNLRQQQDIDISEIRHDIAILGNRVTTIRQDLNNLENTVRTNTSNITNLQQALNNANTNLPTNIRQEIARGIITPSVRIGRWSFHMEGQHTCLVLRDMEAHPKDIRHAFWNNYKDY